MAYMVSQRRKEIGVRVALGAQPRQILFEILHTGGLLTIAGAIVGAGLAALASRLVGSLLYGVRGLDTTTYLGAAIVLLAVAVLACLIPGWRAIKIDPVQELRE